MGFSESVKMKVGVFILVVRGKFVVQLFWFILLCDEIVDCALRMLANGD